MCFCHRDKEGMLQLARSARWPHLRAGATFNPELP